MGKEIIIPLKKAMDVIKIRYEIVVGFVKHFRVKLSLYVN